MFIPFPTLETSRLDLVELTMAGLDAFHKMRSDERMMKYIPGRLAKTKEDSEKVILEGKEKLMEGNNITWAIKLKENNQLIGTIGYYRIQWNNWRGEIGYILHPDYQGKGIMSEAMKEVINYGFNTLKFHTIEAVIDPENKPSENILLRNGFVKEAHFKENFFCEGKFYDSLVYTKFSK